MENSFLLGILLAIPIGILANLATRPVQAWLDSWSRYAPLRKAEALRKRLARAERAKARIHTTIAILSGLFFLSLLSLVALILMVLFLQSAGADLNAPLPWRFATDVRGRNQIIWLVFCTFLFLLAFLTVSILLSSTLNVLRDIDLIERMRRQLLEQSAGNNKN